MLWVCSQIRTVETRRFCCKCMHFFGTAKFSGLFLGVSDNGFVRQPADRHPASLRSGPFAACFRSFFGSPAPTPSLCSGASPRCPLRCPLASGRGFPCAFQVADCQALAACLGGVLKRTPPPNRLRIPRIFLSCSPLRACGAGRSGAFFFCCLGRPFGRQTTRGPNRRGNSFTTNPLQQTACFSSVTS